MLNQIGMAVVRQQVKSTCQDLRTRLHQKTQKLHTDAKAFYRKVKTNPNFKKLMDRLDVLLCCFRRTPINERVLTGSTEVEPKMTSQKGERKRLRKRLEERKEKELPAMRQARDDDFLTRNDIKQSGSLAEFCAEDGGKTVDELFAEYRARHKEYKPAMPAQSQVSAKARGKTKKVGKGVGYLQRLKQAESKANSAKAKQCIGQKKAAIKLLSLKMNYGADEQSRRVDYDALMKGVFNSQDSMALLIRMNESDVPLGLRKELLERISELS